MHVVKNNTDRPNILLQFCYPNTNVALLFLFIKYIIFQWWVKVKVLVIQLCLPLWDPIDFSLPGSFVHRILQARILEWVIIPFSRGSCRPMIWTPKRGIIVKDPDAGKDWRQEETGVTEDEMVAWHQWFNGHEFEQTLGDSEWQGSLFMGSQRVAHDLATEQ